MPTNHAASNCAHVNLHKVHALSEIVLVKLAASFILVAIASAVMVAVNAVIAVVSVVMTAASAVKIAHALIVAAVKAVANLNLALSAVNVRAAKVSRTVHVVNAAKIAASDLLIVQAVQRVALVQVSDQKDQKNSAAATVVANASSIAHHAMKAEAVLHANAAIVIQKLKAHRDLNRIALVEMRIEKEPARLLFYFKQSEDLMPDKAQLSIRD